MMSHLKASTTPQVRRAITRHATTRMQQRGIRQHDIEAALVYGRTIYARGVTFFVIGHKEVQTYLARGIDLEAVAGIQVLVGSDGAIVTTYRSHDIHAIKSSPRAQRRLRAMSHH